MYASPVGDLPDRSGTGDLATEVETDVPLSRKRATVTRRLFPLLVEAEAGL